jgi:hypothetical protein
MARKKLDPSSNIQTAAGAPVKHRSTTRSKASSSHTRASEPSHYTEDVSTAGLNQLAQALDREQVAKLAYSYWEGRGYQGGCPEDDWFRAEQELRGSLS